MTKNMAIEYFKGNDGTKNYNIVTLQKYMELASKKNARESIYYEWGKL